jgi:uncharacterized protein
MARKLFRRYLPSAAKVKDNPSLHFLGDLLHDPNLFHLNRHSVSVAFFVGIFMAALLVRCNLPISVALVWLTNPLTMPAIFFATYQLGRWLLGVPPISVSLELSWEWLANEFVLIWKPLIVGSLLCGLIFGALGYVAIQIFWRWHVVKGWNKRKKRPKAVANEALKQDDLADKQDYS